MTAPQREDDFAIIDEKDIKIQKAKEAKNLKEALIKLGFLNYNELDEEAKKAFDELETERPS